MGQRESTQGVKRKREEDDSNNEQEKSKIIQKIKTEFQNFKSTFSQNKPMFIEKRLILDCKEEQDILYVLLGEVHPDIEKLESQAKDAAGLINAISQSTKDTNKNVSIFLLTERSTCGSDFTIYWNKIHEDLSSNLYSDVISCDTRNEFLVCEAKRLLSELITYKDISNPELYINKYLDLIEKHKEIFKVTREIIDNPKNIFNYIPLKNKDFDEQTKTKIINIINNILNDIINKGRTYREVLKSSIDDVEQMTTRNFLNNTGIQMLKIEENEDDTAIKGKLVEHAVEMEKFFKRNMFGWFNTEIFNYQAFDDRDYLAKLYGVIMDAEVMYQIQTIKNSEKDKKLKMIMIYAGSEHINVYEKNLFSELICNKENIE